MPRFEPKTFTFFLERMANRVVARTELTDLEEGGVLHTILAAAARELDDMSFQMVNLQRVWDLDTASGEDLDDRALDFNPDKLERSGLSFASGQVEFARSGTSGDVTIPQGSIAKVADGGPQFSTTGPTTVLDGFTTTPLVGIIALEGGAAGNVDSGTITQLDAVAGIETVTNPAATIGGQEVETDAEFRSRIKTFLRSLPRGTPDALKFAVLTAFLPDLGRVVTAEVIELQEPELGIVHIFADDGSGTIEVTADNIGFPETVVSSAIGGEARLFLDNKPVKLGTAIAVEINAAPVTEGVDFTLNRASGQITLDPILFPTGLAPTDNVTAEYTWLEGLIAEAQKIVDGDPNDRINFPGYRAAGTQVFILPPTVLQQIVDAAVVIDANRLAEADDIRTKIRSAINRYINGLGINGDVILSELIFQAQSIDGVVDVTFSSPPSNVIIGEGELARVTDGNIDLT